MIVRLYLKAIAVINALLLKKAYRKLIILYVANYRHLKKLMLKR